MTHVITCLKYLDPKADCSSPTICNIPMPLPDMVNQPPHYKSGGMEVIDVIEAFKLPYHLGAVVKYVLRCDKKGALIEDLKKARWYLDRYITRLEKNGV